MKAQIWSNCADVTIKKSGPATKAFSPIKGGVGVGFTWRCCYLKEKTEILMIFFSNQNHCLNVFVDG